MKLDQSHVGKKVRKKCWDRAEFTRVLFLGKDRFFGVTDLGEEGSYFIDDDEWELVSDPKKPSAIIAEKIGGRVISVDKINSNSPIENSAHYANIRIGAILEYLDEQAEKSK